MNSKEYTIRKATGDKDIFRENKLRKSLIRSGADENTIESIVTEIKKELYEGIASKEIYKKAFGLLKKTSRSNAARYKLKNAILELGPSGYPFEILVGEILSFQGFKTDIGVTLRGHCVDHEVDVLAEKDKLLYVVECKFHNDLGRTSDVKVPLYIHSRFQDLKREWLKNGNETKYEGWIFTNTRFSSEAITYANCAGLNLVSWDYPDVGSLKDRIDLSGLHPITCLTSMSNKEKAFLLSREIIICNHLLSKSDILKSAGISGQRIKKISREIEELCKL